LRFNQADVQAQLTAVNDSIVNHISSISEQFQDVDEEFIELNSRKDI